MTTDNPSTQERRGLSGVLHLLTRTLDRLADSSPWALVCLIALPLASLTVVVVFALSQPAVSEAVASKLSTNTEEMAVGIERLDRSVGLLHETLRAQSVRGDRHAAALEDLTKELRRLVVQVNQLAARVAQLEGMTHAPDRPDRPDNSDSDH